MPKTKIKFDGLLVFRPDPAGSVCEVGILRARVPPNPHEPPHILQIAIMPNPDTGSTDPLILDPNELEQHVQDGNVHWRLDVARNGQAQTGLVVNTAIPLNRHDTTAAQREDFGWIINLESGEFHSNRLFRQPDQLKPVISMQKGRLFTSCKTDSIDLKQGPNSRSDFGFIAGQITLEIDTPNGELVVLYFLDQQNMPTNIFRLTHTDTRDYSVSIRNTPLDQSGGGHFHLYYDLLFKHVGMNERFDILRSFPPISPPDRCPTPPEPDPNPFKCGGVSVGSGSGPLGS